MMELLYLDILTQPTANISTPNLLNFIHGVETPSCLPLPTMREVLRPIRRWVILLQLGQVIMQVILQCLVMMIIM